MNDRDGSRGTVSSPPLSAPLGVSPQHTGWGALLRQLEEVHQRMEHRLEKVRLEIQHLEALRGSIASEMLIEPALRRRSVVVLCPRDDGKRDRDESRSVKYAISCRARRNEAAIRLSTPFREAALYVNSRQLVVRVAELDPSEDEKARQEVEFILPSCSPHGLVKANHLPLAGAARLLKSLTGAGLNECDFTLSRSSTGRFLIVHAGPDTSDVEDLCAAVPEGVVHALCHNNIGDSATIASCLYTLLAERATLRAMILPTMRSLSAKLLRLPPSRQHLLLEAILWTLEESCGCCDRDLVENSHVQWCKVLQAVSPLRTARRPFQRIGYATGYCQLLQGLSAVSSVRQGYLTFVLIVCGDFFDLLNAGKLPLQRKAAPFVFSWQTRNVEGRPPPPPSLT
ncbi:hypothetical protein JKF63_05205 [Porcisia hertigi]|uniref:Uncharacterized protein n=1 Tax=Porcisia hertigi TaxID=2761500 RepID=A0A836HZN6_9TRYP|nr:hypothetical protein JKF63_05205 [Porcisia hertigi]